MWYGGSGGGLRVHQPGTRSGGRGLGTAFHVGNDGRVLRGWCLLAGRSAIQQGLSHAGRWSRASTPRCFNAGPEGPPGDERPITPAAALAKVSRALPRMVRADAGGPSHPEGAPIPLHPRINRPRHGLGAHPGPRVPANLRGLGRELPRGLDIRGHKRPVARGALCWAGAGGGGNWDGARFW